jgi:hypothetical protein
MGGRAAVVGAVLSVFSEDFAVVGITPDSRPITESTSVWVPGRADERLADVATTVHKRSKTKIAAIRHVEVNALRVPSVVHVDFEGASDHVLETMHLEVVDLTKRAKSREFAERDRRRSEELASPHGGEPLVVGADLVAQRLVMEMVLDGRFRVMNTLCIHGRRLGSCSTPPCVMGPR